MSLKTAGRTPTSYRRLIIYVVAALAVLILISSFYQGRISTRYIATHLPSPSDARLPWSHSKTPPAASGSGPAAPPSKDQQVPTVQPGRRPPSHEANGRKGLVLATLKGRSIDWLANVSSDWEVFNYVSDDPDAEYTVPINIGREAMVYLTYIIDHYDDLPDSIIFAHGHERAWHQPEPFTYILEALNLDAVQEHGWINLRCTLNPSCIPAPGTWVKTKHIPPGDKWWSYITRGLFGHLYRPGDPWYNATLPLIKGMRIPPLFASPCCAQFAVSKQAVLAKPLEFWVRAREPIMDDPGRLNDKWWPGAIPSHGEGMTTWNIGVAYERTWHYLFGKDAINCLDENYCRKVVYQDRISCNGQTSVWEKSQNYDWITCSLRDAPHRD